MTTNNSKFTIHQKKAKQATIILRQLYHSPRHNNKNNPLDELIFILLSQMTTHHSYERVFNRLKKTARSWKTVRTMPTQKLKRLIKDAGLSNQKAPRIKAILNRLYLDFGKTTLNPLRFMSTPEAENYLVSLPGVQLKTAKCVLMYSLKRKLLPIDTHVLRVANRIGLINERIISNNAHQKLELIVKPQLRYAFHVNAISHGRSICLAKKPRCSVCKLKTLCKYYQTN